MLCKYLTGSKAGQTFHAPRTREMQTLVDLGAVEIVEPDGVPRTISPEKLAAFRNPPVTFAVVPGQGSNARLESQFAILMTLGGPTPQRFFWGGPADDAARINRYFQSLGWAHIPDVPQHIIDQYRNCGPEAQARSRFAANPHCI